MIYDHSVAPERRTMGDMLVQGLLCRLQAQVREYSKLFFELTNHPDYRPEDYRDRSKGSDQLKELWESLRADFEKIWQVPLKPFYELVHKGPPYCSGWDPLTGPNPLRKTLKVAKKDADKARRKDPTISFLESTDLTKLIPQHD